MNAVVSTYPVPHTVRIPVELREQVAGMLERGEIAPGAVAETLQHAMRAGLAAALDVEVLPPRSARRARRQRPLAATVELAHMARVDALARAVTVARAHLAAGGTQRGAVAALNELGLLNTRRYAAAPWTVWSLGRALSMSSESSVP